MYIFGGFVRGERTNEVYIYNFRERKWHSNYQNRNILTYTQPKPRNGHSAVVFEGMMYVFGGQTNHNVRLNDMWRFDLNTYEWKEIVAVNAHETPK